VVVIRKPGRESVDWLCSETKTAASGWASASALTIDCSESSKTALARAFMADSQAWKIVAAEVKLTNVVHDYIYKLMNVVFIL